MNLWCFYPAAAEQKYGHISKWDVSRVTNMSELFCNELHFNEDISALHMSNVTNMLEMFQGAAPAYWWLGCIKCGAHVGHVPRC